MLALLVLTAAVSLAQERPLSLDEAFSLARRRSEGLAAQAQQYEELQGRIDELLAAVLPRLSLRAAETLQDVPPPSASGSSLFGQRHREEARLAFRQPLFSGFREFAVLKAARARGEASERGLRRADELLRQDVGRAFLDLLGARWQIKSRERLIGLTGERVKELLERKRLGRSRESEVAAARAQLALLEAELERGRGLERLHQELLRFLTGLEEDLAPVEPPLGSSAPVAGFLAGAGRRADVAARREEASSEAHLESAARRQRFPTLTADANYHLKRPPGFQEKIKWDVAFSLELPLYTGGAVPAQIRQARARRSAAELLAELAERKARQEIRSSHQDLSSSLSTLKALERAWAMSEANARLQAEDYRLGQVTNLDVLGSLNALQEIRLRLDQTRIEALWAQLRLAVASGGLP